MALVLAVMHLYDIFTFFIASFHSLKKKNQSGIDKSKEWSTIPACPSLMCFFNRVDTEGTNLRKFCVRCLCLFCFV